MELLILRVVSEGLDAVAAVPLHHGRIIIHGEIYPNVRLAALVETTRD